MSFIDSDLGFDPVAGTRQVAQAHDVGVSDKAINSQRRPPSTIGSTLCFSHKHLRRPLAIKVVIMVKKGDEGS